MNYKHFSQKINDFHNLKTSEEGYVVGYAAIIFTLKLPLPFPKQIALISEKSRKYQTENYFVLTPRHEPQDTLYHHLVFALKYEGINLLFFKKLFEKLAKNEVEELVQVELLGKYSRKIWFLYEFLMAEALAIPDLKSGNYVALIDDKKQYANAISTNSNRHRIQNNLPGTRYFCPLIRKTPKLEAYIQADFAQKNALFIKDVQNDLLRRAAAFLLLKDSKSSFFIENENPSANSANRWARIIGEAGINKLTKVELLDLQQVVIGENPPSHIKMGFRTEGGFVGEHDIRTLQPIPEHISARWQDVEILIEGLLETMNKLVDTQFHPVLSAAKIAFGFVFIHPFVDGNGRIHRYLIHYLLGKMKFTSQGIIFPISSTILERIGDYRKTLESYSHPLLNFIEWRENEAHNLEVLNETLDYYSYFDATLQAEFLFDCVAHTVQNTLPNEITYLQKYDEMKNWLVHHFLLSEKMIGLLIQFLGQNNGKFLKRAKSKEFAFLSETQIAEIEAQYSLCFL